MKAVLLAAGRGSRLKEFTADQPKCLNRVGGKTLLQLQIAALKAGGVNEVIIVGGYKAEMLKGFGARVILNNRWERTNMVSSLLCANTHFKEPIIVSYSDILYGPDIVSRLKSEPGDAVIVYDRKWRDLWEKRFIDPLEDAESFKISRDGRILEIGKKVKYIEEVQGQYTGLMLYSPTALSWIVELTTSEHYNADRMDMTTLINHLIESGRPVQGMAIEGGWCEVDTPEDLVLANQLHLSKKLWLKPIE